MLVALLAAAAPASAAVRAWVDSAAVPADASVDLTLEHDGQTSAEPDLSPLKQDFDILSQSRTSNVEIMNGNMKSTVRVQLSLAPKHEGQLEIPALSWDSEKSAPLTVSVGAASAGNPQAGASSSGAAQVFVKTTLEPQRSYVQSAFNLTVRIYAAAPVYRADLALPANNDVLVQQLGADKTETVVENGRRYEVVERHYELFPQRSGSLEFPGPVLNAQVPVQRADPFGNAFKDLFGNLPLNPFTGTKPIRVRGDAVNLDVLPRPAGAGGDYWLPAESVTLQAEWRPVQGSVKAGDPVTLDLHLKARGLTAAQLPDLNSLLSLPEGLKAYPDQAKLSNDTKGETVVGERDQSIALIADHAGNFSIPALTVRWWDTGSNQPREVSVPARILAFSPPSQTAVPVPQETPSVSSATEPTRQPAASAPRAPRSGRPWRGVSLALGSLWILTMLAWYLSSRRRQGSSARDLPGSGAVPRRDGSASRARFHEACRANDARAARQALIQWVAAASGIELNLREFMRQAKDSHLTALLFELDRACYGAGRWNGGALLAALPELPASLCAVLEHREEDLAPLYR
jgi:hypothetical protein